MGPTNYKSLAGRIAATVEEKQRTYGDSFNRGGDVLRVLYPTGIQPCQYDDLLAVARIVDKLFRVAQRGADGRDLGGESPYADIVGYGLLGAARDNGRNERAAVNEALGSDAA